MPHTFTVTISDEEYRAFLLRVTDPNEWVGHAIRNKVRKNMIWITEEASKPDAFEPGDLNVIKALIIKEGDVMKRPRDYSDKVKSEIAKRIKMKTRVERDAEELVEMVPR